MLNLKEGELGVITTIRLNYEAQKKLLTYGIGKGSIITKNYSPSFSGLCNITVNHRSISLRKSDAQLIELVKFEKA